MRNDVSTRSPPSSLREKGMVSPGRAVDPMREDAVIARGFFEELGHLEKMGDGFRPADPSPLHRDDDRHHAEARAADGDRIEVARVGDLAALAREPAHRMSEIPEIAKRLPLNEFK